MNIRYLAGLVLGSLLWAAAPGVNAALIENISAYKCPDGSVGITVNDVTAANGGTTFGAVACYGAVYGNDPGTVGGQVVTDLGTFDFLTKYDVGEGTTGIDIGLSAPGDPSGSFTFGSPQTFTDTWLVVLKASNCWAGWVFDGGTYTGGAYQIGFHSDSSAKTCVEDLSTPPALSHISIYGHLGEVPEPHTLALLGIGLVGIGLARRRTPAS